MAWTLTEPQRAGEWISPPRGKIYGWVILKDGVTVANMAADDVDFKEKRKFAEQIVEAMNERDDSRGKATRAQRA